MLARRPLIIIIMMVTLVPAETFGHQAAGQSNDVGAIMDACDATTPASDATPDGQTETSSHGEGFPTGITLTTLAEHPTETIPQFTRGLVLTVRSLTLEPGAVSQPRKATGPILFHVMTGTAGVSINSHLQRYSEGSAVLVETGQNYALRNESVSSVILLRLAVVPAGEETTIGRASIAELVGFDKEVAVGSAAIGNHLHLQGDIPTLSGETRFFLGCLVTEPGLDTGEIVHPGPVSLMILDGQVVIGEAGEVDVGGCVLFQPHAPHRIRVGDAPAVVLVAGAVPPDVAWWSAPAAGADIPSPGGRFTFRCNEPEVGQSHVAPSYGTAGKVLQ